MRVIVDFCIFFFEQKTKTTLFLDYRYFHCFMTIATMGKNFISISNTEFNTIIPTLSLKTTPKKTFWTPYPNSCLGLGLDASMADWKMITSDVLFLSRFFEFVMLHRDELRWQRDVTMGPSIIVTTQSQVCVFLANRRCGNSIVSIKVSCLFEEQT